MYRFLIVFVFFSLCSCRLRMSNSLSSKDRKKDVELVTDLGTMVIRLSDSTPLHRDNFLRLVRKGYYDSVLFHRVIRNFMIQAGDPLSKHAGPKEQLGERDPGYTVPAEFRRSLFHHKGALAAARTGDNVNPEKASSGSQFYIVQGKPFTNAGLDSIETYRMQGRKIPSDQRQVYTSIGGAPHLDQNYTVFGEVIEGVDIVDSIASAETDPNDRPLNDIHIRKMRLIRRKK